MPAVKTTEKKPAAKAAPKKKKEAEVKEKISPQQEFENQLAAFGLADAMQLVDTVGVNYEVVPTDFPGINQLINDVEAELQGIPKHCHIELFSEIEHAGKTSITLAVGVGWQRRGYRVGIVDIEPSMTPNYLRQVGFITSQTEAEALSAKLGYTIYPVRLMQPKVNVDECETDMIYVDKILDVVAAASNVFDFLIIDSVDFMVSEADAAKTVAENSDQMGGVSKPIKSFMRKNSKRRATFWWINHMSQGLGQYARSYTTGGKAIPRASTIRFKIDRVGLIVPVKDGDPVGFTSKLTTIKNRLGGIGRSVLVNYIYGEGFSADYDYFLLALKLKIINKSGAWFFVGKDKDDSKLTVQGEHNMYLKLKNERQDLFKWIKGLIDGEDVQIEIAEEELSDADKLAALEVHDDEDVPEAA